MMNRREFLRLSALGAAGVLGGSFFMETGTAAAQAASFTTPQKLDKYLYYMEYTDYVPDLTTGEKVKTGFACSAVRNGNFYGRNPDYADVPEFVTKVAKDESKGRYARIGMAAILTLKSGEVDNVSEADPT